MTLDEHQRQFECFDKYTIQVEGWLKGELLPFFVSEKDSGRLFDFDTECQCGLGRRRVDYRLVLHHVDIETVVWIELKHFQIGPMPGKTWKASNYFGDKNIGIYNDVDKLSKIIEGDKYLIILATKNPEYEEHGDWEKGLNKFNQRISPLHIKSYLNPSDFPRSYFLSLLEVV